jgi:hypothetical protein
MEVIVGTGKDVATWHIPKGLLSHHSALFRAACNGLFKEELKNKTILKDCERQMMQGKVDGERSSYEMLPSQSQPQAELRMYTHTSMIRPTRNSRGSCRLSVPSFAIQILSSGRFHASQTSFTCNSRSHQLSLLISPLT